MPDLLIRDVPDEVVEAIDANAKRLGLSRTEYLRRTLARERSTDDRKVTVEDLARTAEVFKDLADPEIMRRAWE
ncbi:MAG: type II toxin-antitoxin system VapB family antitoxin [Acidimicrobiales bacterium]